MSTTASFNTFKGKYAVYRQQVRAFLLKGEKIIQIARNIAKQHGLNEDSFRQFVKAVSIETERDRRQYNSDDIQTDKKESEFNWRDWIPAIQQVQGLVKKSKGSQDRAIWKIDTDEPICVVVLGDTQLGSFGTDYELFVKITDEIINTPNLYVILVGDLLQMAIKLRGVLEAHDNLIPVEQQLMFLDSWLQEIKHKVIASTWDNHSVMREENAVGFSSYANLFKRHTIYSSGICHLDIQVGTQVYKWALAHFFSGKSYLNRTHAPTRYMRFEGQDRDIAAQGDFHQPGYQWYYDGEKERLSIVCGSLQIDSGYAKRFFSLTTAPKFPCVVLDPHEFIMTPFSSVKQWLKVTGKSNNQ
jgi:hypothetical protein